MIQPEGTVTYKGHRKSKPGQESFATEKVLKAASEFYEAGKKIEKGEPVKTEEPKKEDNKGPLFGENK